MLCFSQRLLQIRRNLLLGSMYVNHCPACHGLLEQPTDICPSCGRPLTLDLLAEPAAAEAAVAPTGSTLPTARRRGLSRRKMIGLAGVTVAGVGLVGLGIPALVRWLTNPATLAIYPGDDNFVRFLAWSPDGKRLAFGGFDGVVHLWDSTTGQHLRDYPSDGQNYHLTLDKGITWSPDGTRIASFTVDQPVQVWEVTTGQVLTSYGDPQAHPFAFAWSPDWARIALSQMDTVQIFDSRTRVLLATYRGHTTGRGDPVPADYLFWSPDGTLIASVGLGVRPVIHIWEAATGNPVTLYHGHEGSGYRYDFEGLSWSPDGTRLVSVDIFSGIQVWEAISGSLLLRYRGHDSAGGATAMAWSPNGKRIVSGGDDRTAQVWEASTGKTLLTYDNTVAPAGLAWSPDGKRIASIASKAVRVWSAG